MMTGGAGDFDAIVLRQETLLAKVEVPGRWPCLLFLMSGIIDGAADVIDNKGGECCLRKWRAG